eukprot:1986370-Rhodomonas_salina.1
MHRRTLSSLLLLKRAASLTSRAFLAWLDLLAPDRDPPHPTATAQAPAFQVVELPGPVPVPAQPRQALARVTDSDGHVRRVLGHMTQPQVPCPVRSVPRYPC